MSLEEGGQYEGKEAQVYLGYLLNTKLCGVLCNSQYVDPRVVSTAMLYVDE